MNKRIKKKKELVFLRKFYSKEVASRIRRDFYAKKENEHIVDYTNLLNNFRLQFSHKPLDGCAMHNALADWVKHTASNAMNKFIGKELNKETVEESLIKTLNGCDAIQVGKVESNDGKVIVINIKTTKKMAEKLGLSQADLYKEQQCLQNMV